MKFPTIFSGDEAGGRQWQAESGQECGSRVNAAATGSGTVGWVKGGGGCRLCRFLRRARKEGAQWRQVEGCEQSGREIYREK